MKTKKRQLKTRSKFQPKVVAQWLFVILFMGLGSFMVNKNATDLRVSVLPTKQSPPYDGLVMPVQKAPIWTSLTAEQYKAEYSAIPAEKMQNIPFYDAAQLKTPVEQLGWKTPADLATRNAKITYSTPYMGNYKLDGVEGAGSHLAVDIKVPKNTPVYAIGSGVVVKVSNITTGFGTHIVVRHDNFPSFDNPNVLTTYYSSYNHLSSALVSEDDVVTKGQQIGLSGQTGDATTPHVHFQIDNINAPWHPYWHFTYKEASDAGYDFVGAINAGFMKDRALATTINPVVYIQKYMSTTAVSPNAVPVEQPTPSTSPPTPPVTNPDPTPITPVAPPVAINNPVVTLQVLTDKAFVLGEDQTVTVKALDAAGKIVADYRPENGLSLSVENGGATLTKSLFASAEINNGVVTTSFKATTPQSLQIAATDGKITGHSEVLQGILFKDVNVHDAIVPALAFLKAHDVIGGYPDGSFKSENVVSRVEALKFILKGINKTLQPGGDLPFKDTKGNEWYATYVATASQNKFVSGYPDGSFKPGDTVNRAEFLKMLLLAMGVQLDTNVTTDVFGDVPADAWFAPYVKYALDKNLIPTSGKFFGPDTGMTRGEVAEVIYRMIAVKVLGLDKYDELLSVPNASADAYFRTVR